MLTVRDLMNRHVAAVNINSSVGTTLEKMLEEDVSCLIIVDDSSRPVGLINESDLLVSVFDAQFRANPVSLYMQRKFPSISPDESVGQAVEKFLLHRVPHFPVLDSGKLIGILTRREVMRAAMAQKPDQKAAFFTS